MRWPLPLLFLSFAAFQVAFADQPAFSGSKTFDKGELGDFVPQRYQSTAISAPRANIFEKAGSCHDDGLFVMLTPRGGVVLQAAPMILDHHGSLVWTGLSDGQPYNLQVQTYRGEQYLTFWAGNDGVKGHGSGLYYMLDSHYNLRYKLAGGNGLDGDLHEFYLTPNGTALITVYHIVSANLTAWNPKDLGYSKDGAWDWFHINSVEKDESGNYLISSRWMHAVYYINGTSGDILWTLGGKGNDFKDLSGGRATDFASQHHARWHDGYTSITLFDNSNPGPGHPSAGLWLDLDFEPRTVKLRTLYLSVTKSSSNSQGSVQTLPSGNILVGYGANAQHVEFTRDGAVVCEVRLLPASAVGSGVVQSYRASKHSWVGMPLTDPAIAQVNGTLYVSWNGATEVRHWLLEEAAAENATEADFREAKRVPKHGFETVVSTMGIEKPFVRMAALDHSGNILGRTRVVPRGQPTALEQEQELEGQRTAGHTTNSLKQHTFAIVALVFGSVLALLGLFLYAGVVVRRMMKYYHYRRVKGGLMPATTVEQTIDDLELEVDSVASGQDKRPPLAGPPVQ